MTCSIPIGFLNIQLGRPQLHWQYGYRRGSDQGHGGQDGDGSASELSALTSPPFTARVSCAGPAIRGSLLGYVSPVKIRADLGLAGGLASPGEWSAYARAV